MNSTEVVPSPVRSSSEGNRRATSSTNRISRLWDRLSGSPAPPTPTPTPSTQSSERDSVSAMLFENDITVSSFHSSQSNHITQSSNAPATPTPLSRTRVPSTSYTFPIITNPNLNQVTTNETTAVPRLSFANGTTGSSGMRHALEPVVSLSSGRGGSSRTSSTSEEASLIGIMSMKSGGESGDIQMLSQTLEEAEIEGSGLTEGKGKDVPSSSESEIVGGEMERVSDDDEACFVDGWEGKVDFISSLPHEIALYILLHLQLASLLSATEVSRVWQQLALDNLVWRDLFHRETTWRIREDLGETTARLPSKQLESISASVSRRNSYVKRGKNEIGGGVSGSRLGRKLSDMMNELGGLSLTPLGAEKKRAAAIASSVPMTPNLSSTNDDSMIEFRSPTSTATPHRPASGVIQSAFALSPTIPSLSRTPSMLFASPDLSQSTFSTPGPSRRASSSTIPPLGPVPSPSLLRVPSAPLFLDWPKLYRDRYLLDQRWSKGVPVIKRLQGHKDSVYCLQFDEEKLITGSRDKTMRVWDTKTGQCTRILSGHSASVLCLQYDSKILVSGSSDCRVLVWDLVGAEGTGAGKWDIKWSLLGHTMGVLDLCFDDDYIVSCSKDTSIRVWHKATGELYRTSAGHRGPVNAVQLLNNRIVSASGDSLMKLWDVTTGEVIRVFSGHERGLACVQYSPSGKLIASGSNDKSIKIWDAETGACLKTLTGHVDLVRTLAFDETRRRLVSGSYDRTLRIWDLDTGAQLLKYKPHTSLVFDVSFSASKIVSSSHDQTVVILDFGKGLDISKFM